MRAFAFAALAVTFSVSRSSAATLVGQASSGAVVWISTGTAPAATVSEMRNVDKSFAPDLLVIPAGSTVRFPNDDPFFHSIYSRGAVDAFDVGFYSTGPGKAFLFPDSAVIDVHCHIHEQMHAVIVVVDGPWSRGPGFVLRGVAPGAHVLHLWDPAFGERTRIVDVPARNDAVVRVSIR